MKRRSVLLWLMPIDGISKNVKIYVDKRIYFVYTTSKVYPLYIHETHVFWERKMEQKMLSEANVATKSAILHTTQTIIKKWGNSQGIRLSKEILSKMDLKENDTIGIDVYNGKMVIEKINKPQYLNLQERLEAFYKRPIDEIYVESTQEVDVGDPVGDEQW